MRAVTNTFIIFFVLMTLIALRGDIANLYHMATGRTAGAAFTVPTRTLLSQGVAEIKKPFAFLSEIQIHLPEPLRKIFPRSKNNTVADTNSRLSVSEIILLTNKERTDRNLEALIESSKLDASAQVKVNDMIADHYFEHLSPNGKQVSNLAEDQGYGYIIIGENLALGNFSSDADLLASWMESAGHRENILNPAYKNMGAAIGQGIYEGKKVWFAVQHFGASSDTCTQVDPKLKTTIDANQKMMDAMEDELAVLKARIDMKNASGEDTNADIELYNQKVNEYNTLTTKQKDLISLYNGEVKSFNTCISTATQ